MRIKVFLLFLIVPSLLSAADRCKPCPALLSLGAGVFDILRNEDRKLQFQAEYRASSNWCGVQPIAALMFTEKGSVYVCAGANYDIFMGKIYVLGISFAPGIYFKNGGKDLGYPLEFRSSISLSARLPNENRIGAQFYHISNASLGSKNPGAESLVIFYSFAFY